jgi:putative peptidoglycan lipid II flippase
VGLALATSIGAWINLLLVLWLAARRDLIALEPALARAVLKIAAAGVALAAALWLGQVLVAHLLNSGVALRDEGHLALLVVTGAVVYGGVVLALFGRQWLKAFRRPAEPPPL